MKLGDMDEQEKDMIFNIYNRFEDLLALGSGCEVEHIQSRCGILGEIIQKPWTES